MDTKENPFSYFGDPSSQNYGYTSQETAFEAGPPPFQKTTDPQSFPQANNSYQLYPQLPTQYNIAGQNTSQYSPQVQQPPNHQQFANQARLYQSFNVAIAFSCFVFWCCGWIFGLIGFILAMTGQNSSGDEAGARRMLRASYGFSIVGFIAGIIIIIVVAAVFSSGYQCVQPTCKYGYYIDDYSCRACCPSVAACY